MGAGSRLLISIVIRYFPHKEEIVLVNSVNINNIIYSDDTALSAHGESVFEMILDLSTNT